MSISITFPDQSTPTPLEVLKQVSDGKFPVYQVSCKSTRANYALKVFPKDPISNMQYRKEKISFTFNHPNIIKHINGTITSENDKHFNLILSEFAQYGDLFEFVTKNFFDSEILVRSYFHQVFAGIEYMHSQGVAHLDLKLENLMMGEDFTLKIIDFDQAQQIIDKGIMSGGTEGFRAPEVINGGCKDLVAADVYSLGIILYALKAQSLPFAEVVVQEKKKRSTMLKFYSTFSANNSEFWEMKAHQKKNAEFFSEDFKKLVNSMLQENVSKRASLKDIKNSEWFKGPVLSGESLKAEMSKRWERLQKK